MSLKIDNFISHRFRGFAPRENSLDGLRSALAQGVQYLEFDIRVTKCGTPIIYHDEYAIDENGKKQHIYRYLNQELKQLGGDFAHMPSFEALVQTFIGSGNKTAHLLVDIKDSGFEEVIYALIKLYRLETRVTIVSWLPDILYRFHEIDSDIPLCLSHWCEKPGSAIQSKHRIYTAKNGDVPRSNMQLQHGKRSGWFIDQPVSGPMLHILQASKGSVCVPVTMVSRELVSAYHDLGLPVSVFSYLTLKQAQHDKDKKNIDLFFVDDRQIFDAL